MYKVLETVRVQEDSRAPFLGQDEASAQEGESSDVRQMLPHFLPVLE